MPTLRIGAPAPGKPFVGRIAELTSVAGRQLTDLQSLWLEVGMPHQIATDCVVCLYASNCECNSYSALTPACILGHVHGFQRYCDANSLQAT